MTWTYAQEGKETDAHLGGGVWEELFLWEEMMVCWVVEAG